MLITKFDPFKQLREIEKSLYAQNSNNEGVSAFVPTVNTREGEFAYHIDVDLPGVKKEDIKVDLNKGVLTISGERKTKDEVKHVDIENIEAKSDNGVLEVVIPKLKDDVARKSIEIK